MKASISIRELRASTKGIINAVLRGDKIVLTYRGEPCAQILPLDDAKRTSKDDPEDILFGIWDDQVDDVDVDAYVRKLRKGRFG